MKNKYLFFVILIIFLLNSTSILAYSHELREEYTSLAKQNPGNYQVCDNETYLNIEDICLKNPDLCEMLDETDSNIRDICLQEFALETKNPDLCEMMGSERFEVGCYQYSDLKLNSYWYKQILINLIKYAVLLVIFGIVLWKIQSVPLKFAIPFGLLGIVLYDLAMSMEFSASNPLFARIIPDINFIFILGGIPCYLFWMCSIIGFFIAFFIYAIIGLIIGYLYKKIKSK